MNFQITNKKLVGIKGIIGRDGTVGNETILLDVSFHAFSLLRQRAGPVQLKKRRWEGVIMGGNRHVLFNELSFIILVRAINNGQCKVDFD